MSSIPNSMELKLKGEKLISMHQQPKFALRTPAGLPFRMLKELDEEGWLSGSELKTDNSTSEDEEVRRPFGSKSKLRSKGKRKINTIRKVMSFNSSSTRSSSSSSTTKSVQKKYSTLQEGSEELAELMSTTSLWSVTDSDGARSTETVNLKEEKQWRPKRGSISLVPGLSEQIEIK